MDIAGQFAQLLEVIPPALGLTASLVGLVICVVAQRRSR